MRARWLPLLLLAACGGEAFDEDIEGDEVESSVAESELRTNRNPDRLVVWSNNIENMIFDWKDLVHAMSEADYRPDVFLVQQVTDREEMDRLVDFMSRRLGVDYTGVVAKANPDDRRFQGQVIPRPTVTTGIVYRTGRFEQLTKDSFMPWGQGFREDPARCDLRSDHSGYETLRLKLHDKVADKDVVVISLRHWTFHPCSTKNVRDLVHGFDGGANDHAGLGTASALHIVGGDFNDGLFTGSGSYKCWYRMMNREVGEGSCANGEDFGFTDPLYDSCNGDRGCIRGKDGIDSIFVRRSDGRRARTGHFDVVSFAEAHRASVRATGGDGRSNLKSQQGYNDVGASYSQHQARRAWVYYD